MGNTVIEASERDGMVLPMSLKLGVFSTASVDNIDVEIYSSLSTTSLHGTAASINQHPKEHNQGQPREKIMLNQHALKLRRLPDWYTEVKPFHLPNDVSISHRTKPITSKQVEDTVLIEDEKWLQDTNSSSWAVFHLQSQPIPPCQDTSVMLPILRDESKSPATIKHLSNVLIQSIHQLNPNQTAVIGFDQPVYALAKKIPWFQPVIYGQQNLVLMLGVLHIEMVLVSCLGDWLKDSGWTTALSNAGVTSSGNDSLLSGHEVGKTKYAHQVTALTLYQLMKDAFEQSKKEDCTLNFTEWRASKELESLQFQFWSIALKMEMDYFLFLRSIRSSNFQDLVYCINRKVFAMDLCIRPCTLCSLAVNSSL